MRISPRASSHRRVDRLPPAARYSPTVIPFFPFLYNSHLSQALVPGLFGFPSTSTVITCSFVWVVGLVALGGSALALAALSALGALAALALAALSALVALGALGALVLVALTALVASWVVISSVMV